MIDFLLSSKTSKRNPYVSFPSQFCHMSALNWNTFRKLEKKLYWTETSYVTP